MRRTEGEVVNAVLSFLHARCGRDEMNRAWDQFSVGSTIESEILRETIFIPWLVFTWRPHPSRHWQAAHKMEECQPAMAYLLEHGAHLDEYRKSFIREACAEPFTFFLVTAVEPHLSLTIRDLLLEREVTVKERHATETLRRGNIIYGRCISLGEQSILLGVGPVPLPPDKHTLILDIRDMMRKAAGRKSVLDRAFLLAEDDFLRNRYFEIADQVLNPPPPVLQNTDGDPLLFIKLKYDLLCPPEQVLEELKSLALPEFQQDILDDAEFDGTGHLIRASVTWQKKGNRLNPGWDNTSLGTIAIRSGALEIEVNSDRRAKEIRQEIKDRLGSRCRFLGEEHKSPEALLGGREGRSKARGEGRPPADDLESVPPEFRAALQEQMKAHWEAWLDIPIPALKGQTPRAAARTPQGRERLEALLMEYEYRNDSALQPELRPDVAELRRRLGLPG
jgi:hypothetical protein